MSFDTGRESELPYFGWLSNQIPGYPASVNIKAMVHTSPVGIRPQLRVIEEGHRLLFDQEHGVTEERAEELIHASLHRVGVSNREDPLQVSGHIVNTRPSGTKPR